MEDQPELPDPLTIPLPDEIPLPDDIPLPPVDEEEQVIVEEHDKHKPPTRKRKRGESTPPPNDDDTCESDYKKPCSEEAIMSKLMGFTSFNSTKGKPVPGNQSVGAVHVVKRRRYRQYMNRKGGFNRPLDKVN